MNTLIGCVKIYCNWSDMARIKGSLTNNNIVIGSSGQCQSRYSSRNDSIED